jgi:nitroimidazol reductase NimA-like FMN-containing flavoprotein (pyridoxamine 5'-phosphate oxidase superfamily)
MSSAAHLEILDDEQCLAMLRRHAIGRIGLSSGALPVVLPVNFVLDGRSLLFRTEPGLKLDAALQGTVACLEVDDYDVMAHSGSSVVATGRLGVVTDESRLRSLAHLPLRPWAVPHARHLIELPIELLSGRTISMADAVRG